jgi:ABC-2 type transport system ATP-binding protein
MAATVIECVGLRKHFHSAASLGQLLRGRLRGARVEALAGVDLAVQRGEIVALMGANGVGKSTLLRCVAGLLSPDAGQLRVLGVEAGRADAAFRRRVCYVVSDERSFSWRLSGEHNLEFFAALHGLDRRKARARIARAIEIAGLGAAAGRPVREYSTGMRQRLAIARGLLGDPELVLIDELTRGVDPRAAAQVRRLMREELGRAGRTALIATHDLAEAAELATRVVVLEAGTVVADGAPAEARRLIGLADAAAWERA